MLGSPVSCIHQAIGIAEAAATIAIPQYGEEDGGTATAGAAAIANNNNNNYKNPMTSNNNQYYLGTIGQVFNNKDPSTTISPSLLLAQKLIRNGREDAFSVVNLNNVIQQMTRWKNALPRVRVFSAVKCNPDVEIMKTLASLGAGFDVASSAELDLVLTHTKTSLDDIIYANPCKGVSHIKHVASTGVRMTTFDNVDELYKIHKLWPNAQLVVRILGDDSSSVCRFNAKFGIAVEELPPLLREAARIGANVIGVSFHVGSGCASAIPFVKAVEAARMAFDLFVPCGLPEPKFLDLGGGWPGTPLGEEEKGVVQFEDIAAMLCPTLDRLFPVESGVRIIAEPGRYFAHSSSKLFTCVSARRAVYPEMPSLIHGQSVITDNTSVIDHHLSDDETHVGGPNQHNQQQHESSNNKRQHMIQKGYRLYQNDGLYGSFNCVLYDHRICEPSGVIILADGTIAPKSDELLDCSIWGPTCDGIDCVTRSVPLPEVEIGSWLVWDNMGAYTTPAASTFNGFAIPNTFYING
jgi:ornithine decarboxylase